MKTSIYATAIAMSLSAAAHAQGVTTEAQVGGATGDQTYSLRVIGANGITYNCRPDLVEQAGQQVRLCRRAGVAGTTIGSTVQNGGFGATGGVIAGVLGLLAIASASGTN